VKILPVTLFKTLVAAFRNPPDDFDSLKRVTVLLSKFTDDGWLSAFSKVD
jgi:hypothetical protein